MKEMKARPSRRGTVTRIPRRGSGEDQRNYRALYRFVDPSTGKVRTRSKDFKLKIDATRYLETLKREAGMATRTSSSSRRSYTVREWLGEWHRRRLDPEEGTPIRPKTAELDRLKIRRINAVIGGKALADVTTTDVLVLDDQLREEKVGRRMREMVIGALRGALAEAVDNQWIVDNPAETVLAQWKRTRRRDGSDRIGMESTDKTFTRDELTLILEGVDQPAQGDGLPDVQFGALVHLLAGSALRIGEALGLQWRDLDLDEGVVRVSQTLTRDPALPRGAKLVRTSPKTQASIGAVPIDGELVQRLRAFREWRTQEKGAVPHPTAFVFMNSVGKPCRAGDLRSEVFYPLLKRLGIDRKGRSFHAFRHTHVSLIQEAGVSLATASARARHANPAVTARIYSHATREASLEAAGAFRLALGGKAKEKEVGHAF